ncbi:MAG: hypothetical protein P1P85_04530 [Patescibacteria group bacterium]|nr:hypothetical protein [Patescibacteria group bacterium]
MTNDVVTRLLRRYAPRNDRCRRLRDCRTLLRNDNYLMNILFDRLGIASSLCSSQ